MNRLTVSDVLLSASGICSVAAHQDLW